ncbi:MAG TPA: class I SAM-dependent methyltransferase [Candidatus Deferrimicrobiaceae bacterium]|nr:class I SAM-dependent methyltransferase [Candidatus Deferrimicrobiaceae bacterium]
MGSPEKPLDLSAQTHWEYAAQTRMGQYLTDLETEFISKSIDLSKENLTIMDVGAEAGRFSLFAANTNAYVVSVDLDSYALRRLHLKNRGVNVIQADARHLPLKDAVFDVVFMVEVLDYIPELDQALVDCKRTLKPDSSCVLSFGNKSSLKAKLKAMQGKSYRHSYGEVVRCLSKAGFNLKNKLGYSWLPFGRTSQSSLVGFLAGVEKIFGLRRIVRYSPWVIIHVTNPP